MPENTDAPVSVTIATEGGRTTFTFSNGDAATVASLIEATAGLLNLSGANIAVNGAPASAETVLDDGDEVSTTKPAGRKG